MNRARLIAGRDGFTLIEVVVAMVILAIVLAMLASFSMGTATQLFRLSQGDVRQALTLREVNRLAALPYDSLPAAAGCRSVTIANLAHTSCVTVTNGTRNRTVRIIVTPQRAGTYADTIVFQRAAPFYNPFNTQ
ncbi:MAG: prepilin-type N-terminal cleavage/methylation domain-containing protein [Gemmatimonadetes bacterium]|nr:prepilin-type N-terminal cleavage/methylation domain-containing protein [Gemmatimonadota bacterium]